MLGCLGCDQFVRLANEGCEFVGRQNIGVGKHHPLVASDVGRGGYAFDLEQFAECFRRAFKGDARKPTVREDHAGEDFAADFEAEVVAPRHILGYVGEGETEFANPVDVGHCSVINCGLVDVSDDFNIVKRFKANGELLRTPGKLSP